MISPNLSSHPLFATSSSGLLYWHPPEELEPPTVYLIESTPDIYMTEADGSMHKVTFSFIRFLEFLLNLH